MLRVSQAPRLTAVSNSSHLSGLLSLLSPVSASTLQLDDRFDPLRVLLASAPEDPERRHNFARSLVRPAPALPAAALLLLLASVLQSVRLPPACLLPVYA